MPNLKPSMGDSTLHSVIVVAVVSERQGSEPFQSQPKADRSVWPCMVTIIEGLGRKAAPDEFPPRLMVDND